MAKQRLHLVGIVFATMGSFGATMARVADDVTDDRVIDPAVSVFDVVHVVAETPKSDKVVQDLIDDARQRQEERHPLPVSVIRGPIRRPQSALLMERAQDQVRDTHDRDGQEADGHRRLQHEEQRRSGIVGVAAQTECPARPPPLVVVQARSLRHRFRRRLAPRHQLPGRPQSAYAPHPHPPVRI